MSINPDPQQHDPYAPGAPPLAPPTDLHTTNEGQAALKAKHARGHGRAGSAAELDTITAGGESVSAQQFKNSQTSLDAYALATVTPQLPSLRQTDPSMVQNFQSVIQGLLDSGLVTVNASGDFAVGDTSALQNNPPALSGTGSLGTGGADPVSSKWLAASGAVAAMISLLRYAIDTTRQETELLKVTMAMINIMWDMTLNSAELQRQIGQKEAQAYYTQAAMAAVNMAAAAASAVGSIGLAGVSVGAKADSSWSKGATLLANSGVMNQIGKMVESAGSMVGNILLAENAIAKANLEARQKETEGRITQVKMLLDQMMKSLDQQHDIVQQFLRAVTEINQSRVKSLTATGGGA